jgi:hypothetical protein
VYFICQGPNTKKPMLETLQATLKAKQKIKQFNANVVDNRNFSRKEKCVENELQKGIKYKTSKKGPYKIKILGTLPNDTALQKAGDTIQITITAPQKIESKTLLNPKQVMSEEDKKDVESKISNIHKNRC